MWPISQAFQDALKTGHGVSCKVVMLNANFQEIADETIFSKQDTNDISNFISDGNIDVDTTRGTRRTAELTILNPTAEFTPITAGYKSAGPWTGKIYLNRLIRIYRGVLVNSHTGHVEYVPVGTFMVDECTVEVQQNASLVVLTLSDLWKKLTKSIFTKDNQGFGDTIPKGTPYNSIIEQLLDNSEVYDYARADDDDYRLPVPNLDRLLTRDEDEKVTSSAIDFKQGESRGDRLKELLPAWGIDAYFDPMGRFVTQDLTDPKDKDVSWTFPSGEIETYPEQASPIVSLKRTFSDDNLYNHVVIVGSGNPKRTIRVERTETDPRSKINADLIGDRVIIIESQKIENHHEAKKALNKAWKVRFQLSEEIEAEVICNPALEGNDVVKITEKTYAKIDDTYRLVRFSVPLVTARQVIQCSNILHQEDFDA